MVINIGGLWDRPISVDDERSFESHEEHISMHFKSFSPDQAERNFEYNWPGYLNPGPEFKEEFSPKELISEICVRKEGVVSHKASIDSEGGKSGSICPHVLKALRVRSHGTKDRHSKVSTSKGNRDTRVRLSYSTATQFYEVQHKLGFNHSSKVLDWLMSKASAAIDKLPQPSYISPKNCVLCNSVASGVQCSTSESEHSIQPQ